MEELLVTGTLLTGSGKPNSCMFVGGYHERWWLPKSIISPIRHIVQSSQRSAFIGSAVFITAEIGMLDTRSAVIHPNFQPVVYEEYGVEPSSLDPMLIDGKIFTATGGVAGMLIALEFVKADMGDQFKNAVAQALGIGKIEPTTVATDSLTWDIAARNDELILACILEMRRNIEMPITISALAKKLHVSTRHIERKFTNIIGFPPTVIYKDIRLCYARKLLMQSKLSVIDVGFSAGFGCMTTFHKSYRARFGKTPRQERIPKAPRQEFYKEISQKLA